MCHYNENCGLSKYVYLKKWHRDIPFYGAETHTGNFFFFFFHSSFSRILCSVSDYFNGHNMLYFSFVYNFQRCSSSLRFFFLPLNLNTNRFWEWYAELFSLLCPTLTIDVQHKISVLEQSKIKGKIKRNEMTSPVYLYIHIIRKKSKLIARNEYKICYK